MPFFFVFRMAGGVKPSAFYDSFFAKAKGKRAVSSM
jgi:hypothetical protein